MGQQDSAMAARHQSGQGRGRWAVLCLMALLSGSTALAQEKVHSRGHRFHLGTHAFQKRLSAGAQKSARAIGQYMVARGRTFAPEGTAFIVCTNPARGTALALTAAHVTLYHGRHKQQVDFYPQGTDKAKVSASVERLVAQNLRHDYALVELKLPPGMNDVKPLRLSAAPLTAHLPVYTMGYPDLERVTDRAISRRQGKRTLKRARFATVWSLGQVNGPETRLTRLDVHHPGKLPWMEGAITSYFSKGFSSNVPTTHGSSGGPLLTRDGHGVVGVLNALDVHTRGLDGTTQRYDWGIMSVPTSGIVASLEHLLSGKAALVAGDVAPPQDLKPQLQALVDSFKAAPAVPQG